MLAAFATLPKYTHPIIEETGKSEVDGAFGQVARNASAHKRCKARALSERTDGAPIWRKYHPVGKILARVSNGLKLFSIAYATAGFDIVMTRQFLMSEASPMV